jgi:serine/threonine-protein kinase HipA
MAKTLAILGSHLLDEARGPVSISTLTRDSDGAVAFSFAKTY